MAISLHGNAAGEQSFAALTGSDVVRRAFGLGGAEALALARACTARFHRRPFQPLRVLMPIWDSDRIALVHPAAHARMLPSKDACGALQLQTGYSHNPLHRYYPLGASSSNHSSR